jgi:hypothetical protein
VFYLDATVIYIENAYSFIRMKNKDANSFAVILEFSKITHAKNKYYSTSKTRFENYENNSYLFKNFPVTSHTTLPFRKQNHYVHENNGCLF